MGLFSKNKAEVARDLIGTLEGRRAYIKAILSSTDDMVDLLGADSIVFEDPKCSKCRQPWDQGPVEFQVFFDDNSILSDSVSVTR